MQRLKRDFVELEDGLPLADLIARLMQVQQSLPKGSAEATARLVGDDIFGRKISISYRRPQTAAERVLDARYSQEGELAAA